MYGFRDGIPRNNKYAGQCMDCGQPVAARCGRLHYLGKHSRQRYGVVCTSCQVKRSDREQALRDDMYAYYGSAEAAAQWAPDGW